MQCGDNETTMKEYNSSKQFCDGYCRQTLCPVCGSEAKRDKRALEGKVHPACRPLLLCPWMLFEGGRRVRFKIVKTALKLDDSKFVLTLKMALSKII